MSININTGLLEELKKIPRIGTKRATQIIDFRQKYGKVTKEAFAMVFPGTLTEKIFLGQ